MQGYKKLLLSASFIGILFPLMGQNTDSPYSRYGYGVLNNQSIGASKQMGGISYGVRGLNTNPGNPASYSGVDSLTFNFDIGVSYVRSRLSEGNNKQGHDNGGLDYIAMQFPLSKKLGMSIGLLPFSSVGYSFGEAKTEDELSYTNKFEGSGGFSQLYGGVAYSPIKNLSVGANISYIFGNTTYNRVSSVTSVPSSNIQNWDHKLTINMLRFDFGVQYALNLTSKDNLIIGAVYSPQHRSSGKIRRTSYETNGGVPIKELGDTATYTGKQAYTDLPNKYGVGFTWNRNENLVVGADFTYENWSKMRYSEFMEDNMDKSNRFNNHWKINAGAEYVINPKERSFIKKVKFRGGVNYGNSYINVLDKNRNKSGYKELGITFGFGIPIKDSYSGRSSYINIGFDFKNLSPDNKDLIKERYLGVTLGVSLNELWFMKNKFR